MLYYEKHLDSIVKGYALGLLQAEKIGNFIIPNKNEIIQEFWDNFARKLNITRDWRWDKYSELNP